MRLRGCVPSVLLLSVLTCCPALASARLPGLHADTVHSWRPRVVVPTQGEVWPQPLNQTKSSTTLSLDASTFSFQYEGPCFVVQQALKRYRRQILFQNCMKPGTTRGAGRRNSRALDPDTNSYDGDLNVLKVTVSDRCEDIPDHQMDERYFLSLSSSEESFISARSVWGALRALETFSQLVYSPDGVSWVVNETMIYDEPRFSPPGPADRFVSALLANGVHNGHIGCDVVQQDECSPLAHRGRRSLSLREQEVPEHERKGCL
ncbi:hypothetical protein MTO96_029908 [Rhipicephalus appendiculatus]